MAGVKQSPHAVLLCVAAVVSLSGCAKSQLARFAPPGIIKYEDLAGDQPIDPEVAKRIEEYKQDPSTGEFPRLAETPGKDAIPERKAQAAVDDECAELAARRDVLAASVAEDRALASDELERDLLSEREELNQQLDQDSAAAARERREKLEPLDTTKD